MNPARGGNTTQVHLRKGPVMLAGIITGTFMLFLIIAVVAVGLIVALVRKVL